MELASAARSCCCASVVRQINGWRTAEADEDVVVDAVATQSCALLFSLRIFELMRDANMCNMEYNTHTNTRPRRFAGVACLHAIFRRCECGAQALVASRPGIGVKHTPTQRPPSAGNFELPHQSFGRAARAL